MTNVLLQSMQSSLSGELPNFKHLDDRYKCEICKNVLRVPMTTMCGHRICKECATNYVAQNGGTSAPCPAKSEDCMDFTIDQLVPDFGTHRDLQKLSVYCPNHNYGCEQLVPWGKIKDHVKNCEYTLEDCINKGFGCKERISKVKRREHLLHECQFRTKQCPHCEARIPERLMDEHIQNSCPAVSIICPFKCGEQSIQRKELDEHKKVCQAKPKDCKFKSMGCSFMGTEEEVRRHEAQDSAGHMEYLLGKVLSVDLNNAELRNQLQELQNGIKKDTPRVASGGPQLDKVSQRCEFLEKKQERQEDSLKNMQKMVATINERVDTSSPNASLQNELGSLRETVREMEKSYQKSKGSSDDSSQQLVQMERTLGMCNMRLQEMDLRLQCVETASYDGTLIWKIRDFKRRKAEAVNGRTMSLYSQPFYTSRYGYKACARIYLNGDGMGKGTHMSLFFVILRGDFDALLPWPFRQKVTMTLIDQDGGKKNIVDSFRADPTSNSFKKPTSDMNIASGCPLFAAQSVVESPPFLKDDCIYIKMHVDTKDLKDASYDYKSGSYDSKS